MGKRSAHFRRRPQDAYDTPAEAVAPLLKHLPPWAPYWEPCAGEGALVRHLDRECVVATDIRPRSEGIYRLDGLSVPRAEIDALPIRYIITNPPWTRPILHAMIERFSDVRPTWLLFDADWVHTAQAAPFWWRLRRVVSVGRGRWIAGSQHTGKDNAAWHLFDANGHGPAEIYGKQK